jgi:hypothetical protein
MSEEMSIDELNLEIQRKKALREENCLKEIEEILTKYNCSIKCKFILDEATNSISYDKKIISN